MPQPSNLARRMLAAYCWRDGLDDLIAEWSGVGVDEVRSMREAVQSARVARETEWMVGAHAIARRLRELARLAGHEGSPRALLVRVLDAAIERQRRKVTGDRRSADGTMSRSQTSAETSEGASGDRDPRRAASRGAAWGRGRVGRGPGTATEKRDG